jgi:homoserine acetyltransferase
LHSLGVDVEWVDIDSPHGHDAFLIETATLGPQIAEFLDRHVPSEGATDD